MPERLSLDEFSKEKGKSKFVTVVSDIDKSSLLEVINSHKSEEIIEALQSQPQATRENVKEVSVDMWGGFQKVIKEVFPNALIVIDRFHVMKLVNKSLNKIRLLLELKGLKNRCLLMKNSLDLTEKEQQELQQLLNYSGCLSIGYELKEELREIYEKQYYRKNGSKKAGKMVSFSSLYLSSNSKNSLKTYSRNLPLLCE